jgi:antitoxin (DNA-binding transcriptional repressor) of toxin-antitoxin stability system
MKTIGAKELRNNLDDILDRVVAGEDIIVKHRFKAPIRLSAEITTMKSNNKLAGLQAFDAARKKPSPYDPNKSIKELYRQTMAEKYGL